MVVEGCLAFGEGLDLSLCFSIPILGIELILGSIVFSGRIDGQEMLRWPHHFLLFFSFASDKDAKIRECMEMRHGQAVWCPQFRQLLED